jgi:putative ABC transport system permease protein
MSIATAAGKNSLILRLAWRNVLRAPRRTGFSLAVVALGCIALILLGGFVDRIFWGVREATIHSRTGHLQIMQHGYLAHRSTDPLAYMIANPDPLISALEALPHVRVVEPRIEFSGIVGIHGRSTVFVGMGVDPDKEPLISTFDTLAAGQDLSASDPFGGSVGIGLARAIDIHPGDSLLTMTQTFDGGINAVDMNLRGIFQTDNDDYDEHALKMPLSLAHTLLQTDAVSRLVLVLDDTGNTDAAAAEIRDRLHGSGRQLDVVTWRDLNPTYAKIVRLYTRIFGFVGLVVIVIVVPSISNTMIMSYMERVRELGLMRAIGASRTTVARIFLIEGLLLGLFGALLGAAISLMIVSVVNRLLGGIAMPPPPGSGKGFTLFLTIVPGLPWVIGIGAVCLCALAAAVPIIRTARLQIVSAIRQI